MGIEIAARPSRFASKIIALALGASLATLIDLSHLALRVPNATKLDTKTNPIYVPDGRALRLFSMGQATTVADLWWLRLVQYIGTLSERDRGLPVLYSLVNLVTDLDPSYEYAYIAGGLVLSSVGRIPQSNRILEKGVSNAPKRWEIPFYLAYNHWYESGNFEQGARWLERAIETPGSPPYLPILASRILTTSGQVDAAIELTRGMISGSPDEATRGPFEAHLRDLLIERDLQTLERALALFTEKVGRPAPALDSLVPSTLDSLPRAPDGSSYDYDPKTGEVGTPLLPRRLFVKPASRERVPSTQRSNAP